MHTCSQVFETAKIKQCPHGSKAACSDTSRAEDLEEAAETLPTLLKVSVAPCEISKTHGGTVSHNGDKNPSNTGKNSNPVGGFKSFHF